MSEEEEHKLFTNLTDILRIAVGFPKLGVHGWLLGEQ